MKLQTDSSTSRFVFAGVGRRYYSAAVEAGSYFDRMDVVDEAEVLHDLATKFGDAIRDIETVLGECVLVTFRDGSELTIFTEGE